MTIKQQLDDLPDGQNLIISYPIYELNITNVKWIEVFKCGLIRITWENGKMNEKKATPEMLTQEWLNIFDVLEFFAKENRNE